MNKKKKEPSKEIVKKSVKKGIELWGNVFTSKEEMEDKTKKYCQMVAEVYEVPPTGVVVMGNQPYLNKDARYFLLQSFLNEKKLSKIRESKIHPLQLSTSPEQSAIWKAIIVTEDSYYEAIGEASAKSVKLEFVKSTLNMMAETRAMNRVIWKMIAGLTMERVMKNLNERKYEEDAKEAIIEAGRVSAEEVSHEDKKEEQSKKAFEVSKKTLEEKGVSHLSEEEIESLAEKIDKSTLYSTKQKEELLALIYQG